jgi:hypothetical protein
MSPFTSAGHNHPGISSGNLKAFAKLTQIVDSQMRIEGDPPLIVPIEDLLPRAGREGLVAQSQGLLNRYRRILESDPALPKAGRSRGLPTVRGAGIPNRGHSGCGLSARRGRRPANWPAEIVWLVCKSPSDTYLIHTRGWG